MLDARRLDIAEPAFGTAAASRVLIENCAPWLQDLGILIEAVEAGRPPAAAPDWQAGAVLRLPFSPKLCRNGAVYALALAALADAAMVIACAAAWNGYRPMTPVDQTMHFLRPVRFDVMADARVVRIDRNTSFGRVMLYSAADKEPVGMVASACAMA
jgi:acyl-coenzyme A thioesterase PaaI-like protein